MRGYITLPNQTIPKDGAFDLRGKRLSSSLACLDLISLKEMVALIEFTNESEIFNAMVLALDGQKYCIYTVKFLKFYTRIHGEVPC